MPRNRLFAALLSSLCTLGMTAWPHVVHAQTGGAVSGRVTAADTGLPVAGMEVTVYKRDGSSFSSAMTDAQGRYSAGSLAPGGYDVLTWNEFGYVDEYHDAVMCPGGACPRALANAVTVNVGTTVTGIDFSLRRGAVISGTLRDAVSGDAVTSGYADIFDVTGNLLLHDGKPYSGERYLQYLATMLPDYYMKSGEFAKYQEALLGHHAPQGSYGW